MGTQSKPFDRLPTQHGKHRTFFSCRNFMWCAYAVGCGRLAHGVMCIDPANLNLFLFVVLLVILKH